MDRRSARQRIETLPAAELRRVAGELLSWVGPESAARWVSDGPLPAPEPRSQLVLAAVDAEQVRFRIEAISAVALADARAQASGAAATAVALGADELRGALATDWAEAVAEATRAVAFDRVLGIALASELIESLIDIAHARERCHASGGAWDDGAAAGAAAPAVQAALDSARHAHLDDASLERVLDLARLWTQRTGSIDHWRGLDGAADAAASAHRCQALARYVEQHPRWSGSSLPLLEVLSRAAARADRIDLFVETAELHVDAEPAVVALIASTYHAAGALDEARFWVGEGRIRHPRSPLWDELEGRLF